MSSSPSGIYRSKVLSSVLRQTRRWGDRAQAVLRRVQVATSWSAQILLYPIYALFQASRVLGAQVYQTVQLGIPGLRSTTSIDSSPAADSTSDPARSPITVDTPIATVLQTIQEFALPIGVPVLLEGMDAIVPLGPIASAHPQATPALATDGGGIAIPGSPVFIQGIATLLDSGAVVLVTNQNQILDILTPEQQARLQYRITWEVASYGRALNLRKTVANLPLPKFHLELNTTTDPSRITDRMAQGLSTLGRQLSQTAQQVSQEAYRIVRSGFFGRSLTTYDSQLALPGTSLFTATADTPLEKALQTVQRFPLPMHLLASLLESPAAQLAPSPTLHNGVNPSGLVPSQVTLTPLVLTIPPELAALPALYVRGVASLLETQAIVLVTNQNQLLNLLSPEQQAQIRQRITWAVAHFYRYQQIRQSVQRSFSPVRLPEQQVLLPIRGFYQLMAWVQSGSVAIATNLFQEARIATRKAWATERSLVDLTIPDWAYAHPTSPQPSSLTDPTAHHRLAPSWLETVNQKYHSWLNSRAVQTAIAQVQRQVTVLLPPSRPQATMPPIAVNSPITNPSHPIDALPTDTGLEFGSTARQALLSWQESALALTNSADIWDSYAPLTQDVFSPGTPVSTTTYRSSTGQVTPTAADYIDIQATLLGYLYSPFERLLQWLDRLLLWVEDTVIRVWRWWQQVRRDRPSDAEPSIQERHPPS